MTKNSVTVRVAGAAGDGIAATGEAFAKVCSRSGLHVFAYNSYQSVIRGGCVWLQVKAQKEKVYSHGDELDFLIILNGNEVEKHAPDVPENGGIIFNGDKIRVREGLARDGVRSHPLPVRDLSGEYGKNPVIQNTVALGALMRLLDIEFDVLKVVLEETFGKRKQAALEANLAVSKAGYDYATENFESYNFDLQLDYNTRRPILTGNQSIALGAVAAGCRFYAAYPMTPASSILHWLSAHATKLGMVVKQAEDEISVINMAIGASFVGARVMVGTSGGGFALMTEAIGLAGQTETPIVIVSSQRGSPSTGLPTKTEQGDLFQALGASQGDFPKMIMVPSTVEDCYYSSIEAFNIAARYQLPVIILSDLYLSEHMESIDTLRFDLPIDIGEFGTPNGEKFKRYEFTENGVSPRSIPGVEGTIFQATSDEHDDVGNIISDVFTDEEMRTRIFQKRMKKMEFILKELPPPQLHGPSDADMTLIGWGSTFMVIREAISRLERDGIKVNHLHVKYMMPFQSNDVKKILESCKETICIESNYTGQLSKLIMMETGYSIGHKLLKYDGEPFYTNQIVQKVKEVLRVG